MTYPVIDPTSFGPLKQFPKMPNGDILRGSLPLGPDENGGFDFVGIGYLAAQGEWVQFFEYAFSGDSTGLLESLWAGQWNSPAWNLPAPAYQNPTQTYAQLAASSAGNGAGYTTARAGVLTTFYGTLAIANLYADFASTTTTLGVEECLTNWENTVILAKIQQLWDTTYNVMAPVTGSGLAPPILPAPPPANQQDGLPSMAAVWEAVAELIDGKVAPPLAGSPNPSRLVLFFDAPPTSP